MQYKFTYQTSALDFWQLSMYYTYGSIVGVCNIIFTVAMFLLLTRFWSGVGNGVRVLLIIACCLFTIIQPIEVYRRARRQAANVPRNMDIAFDESGVHVKTKNQSSTLKWETIKRVSKKPNMIVIFSTTRHGFILNNKVLGGQREALYSYVVSKIENK